MKSLVYLVLIFVLIATSLFTFFSYLGNVDWYLDLFAHFKQQYLILSIICALFFLILKKNKAIIFTAPALILNAWDVVPLYFGNTIQNPKTELKISSVNLLSSNGDFSAVSRYIQNEDPDILILQELTDLWAIALDTVISSYYYQLEIPRADNFGIGYYSKIEPQFSKTEALNDALLPSILARYVIDSDTVFVLGTHPLPPINQFQFESRNDQFQRIGTLINSLGGHFVLAGDLNSSSYSPYFKQMVKTSKLKDSRNGYGVLATWPSRRFLMQTTLDHFLVSKDLLVLDRTVGNYLGSDHLPITLKIGIP